MAAASLLIERYLPEWDAEVAEHLLVRANPETTWQEARDLDLLSIHTPLLDAAMWVRTLPARLARRPMPVPGRLTFGSDDAGGLPGWSKLGEQPGRELTLGAVGKFWQPEIAWRDVPREEFARFSEPGWAKLVSSLTTLPYGEHGTLLTYVCRTAATDPDSRRRFLRYWWLVRPFVAHIFRAVNRAVAHGAEARAAGSAYSPG